jgi:hypothetical protein
VLDGNLLYRRPHLHIFFYRHLFLQATIETGPADPSQPTHPLDTIPSRMHDEKRPGDVLKVPGDPLDDVADDARYWIYTFINSTEKPRELEIAESNRHLAEQGDPLCLASLSVGAESL